MVIFYLFSYITIHFTLIITRFGLLNTEIGLDPNNSVIKRLWCIHIAKIKVLISCAFTAQLICVFIFAYAKSWFSHDEAHII